MYYIGDQSISATLGMWTFILLVGSLQFGFVGLNAAHHHPEIYHEGDAARYVQQHQFTNS